MFKIIDKKTGKLALKRAIYDDRNKAEDVIAFLKSEFGEDLVKDYEITESD